MRPDKVAHLVHKGADGKPAAADWPRHHGSAVTNA